LHGADVNAQHGGHLTQFTLVQFLLQQLLLYWERICGAGNFALSVTPFCWHFLSQIFRCLKSKFKLNVKIIILSTIGAKRLQQTTLTRYKMENLVTN
jgi:hypothetical protein